MERVTSSIVNDLFEILLINSLQLNKYTQKCQYFI